MSSPPLYLCAGTQSSGSTLVSWCFLQRPDMDGILDARFDSLPVMPARLNGALPWCKFTIACFRWSEVRDYFTHEGYEVRPLLIVRDVRSVFDSLITKTYGRNGITADDPPIRLRLSRFLEDWRLFQDRGWPMLGFEQFTRDPSAELNRVCQSMSLPFDEAMIKWPKGFEQIADAKFGNETFISTRGGTLLDSVKPAKPIASAPRTPPQDLEWLEKEFADFNATMGYPDHIEPAPPITTSGELVTRAIPKFEYTRRYARLRRKYRVSHFIQNVGETINSWLGSKAQNDKLETRDPRFR